MTVFVDNVNIAATVPNGRARHTSRWCHLMSDANDSDAELVAFARRIGLKPEWLQDGGTPHSHFDVTEPKRRAAIKAGAIEIDWHDLGALLEARRTGKPYTPPGQLPLQ